MPAPRFPADRKPGLGRGLSSLIPDRALHATAPGGPVLLRVPIESIVRNPEQPRSELGAESLQSLADSIRVHGVLSPLLVREEAGRYVLVAGERRWRASGLAGLTEVPVLVTENASNTRDRLVLALVENLQREDLNPVDEALGYRRLTADLGLSQEDVARFVGKDRTTITNALRLLRLPENVLEMLKDGRISTGHAKALLALGDPARLPEALQAVLDRELSVRATERLVQTFNEASPRPRTARELPPPLRRAADILTRSLGTAVDIRPKSRGGGRIVISYGADEELTALVERLRGEQ